MSYRQNYCFKKTQILNHEILGCKSPNKGTIAFTMFIASVRFSKLLKWLPLLEFDHATTLEFDHANTLEFDHATTWNAFAEIQLSALLWGFHYF